MEKSAPQPSDRIRYREKDHEKARLFRELCARGSATRRDLIQSLSLRPTSVSHAVQELVEDGLAAEERGRESGRSGRPELVLRARLERLTAISMEVESREIAAALVDIGGRVLASQAVVLPQESGNEQMRSALCGLARSVAAKGPKGSELLGAGMSLVGTVDPARMRWVSAARWPRLRDLDFRQCEADLGLPFLIRRSLDAELETTISKRPELRPLNVGLFHWGFGIGSAYSHGGTVLGSTIGRFGEIGHTRTAGADGRKCLCGAAGCVETVAALWAVLPELKARYGELPEDERDLGPVLQDSALPGLPVMQKAVEAVGESLMTFHRLFFPDLVLLKGPFFSHPGIYGGIMDRFDSALPDYARGSIRFELLPPRGTASVAASGTAPVAASGTASGITAPFFLSRLDPMLRRKQ